MKNRDVARASLPDLQTVGCRAAARRRWSARRYRTRGPAPEQPADAAGAVANRVALVRRRHPLVDDASALFGSTRPAFAPGCPAGRGRWRGDTAEARRAPRPAGTDPRSPMRPGGVDLRGAFKHLVDEIAAACRRSPARAAVRAPRPAPRAIAIVERRGRRGPHRSARRLRADPRVVQHAGAVHRRRHGGGRIGHHRHAACRTTRRSARRSLRARSRRGRDRPPRSRRSAPRSVTWPVKCTFGHAEPRDAAAAAWRDTSRSRRTSRPAAAATAD